MVYIFWYAFLFKKVLAVKTIIQNLHGKIAIAACY